MMRFVSFSRLLPGLLVLLLVTGCRTYGGYGTEEAIPHQMQEAVQQFASELNRAQSDLASLSEAAQQNSALAPLEAQYRGIVARHETFLEGHRRLAEQFQEGGSYRALNRTYGAMITEQRLVRMWYSEMHARIASTAAGESTVTAADEATTVPEASASRYVVNPSYYDRIRNQQRLTMQEALRGA